MADDFTYIPAYGSSNKKAPRIIMAKFGDGYEQRLGDGINNDPDTWTLHFKGRSDTDADSIESFFHGQGAWDSFTWTPIGSSTQKKFRCSSWSRNYMGPNANDIEAEFVEVFDL